ncbi:MAG: hypothetical protein J6Y36_05060 [Treponema sp.]|uniref:hypothetical protein n=1 Tax=Treponema sp. TaxID=166 RepID=UPI001B4561A1|nr:hypothetical protein [Treponema sp.]MBP5402512.1 hypothetical protein [Treponema sp.]MBR5933132.1 hypothetical protein [Treponema sp.]
MAIQPIDLQTMYSQMSNVANRVSHEQQSAQVASSLQQQSALVQNEQNVKTVNKAADEEAKSPLVKEDGHSNQEGQNSEKKKNPGENSEQFTSSKTEIREEYLGKHINITR